MTTEPTGCTDVVCRLDPTLLDDLLGHDRVGHLARNMLVRAEITTPQQLAALTDRQLLSIRRFGEECLARVREKVPAPQGRLRAWASAPS